jgi:geranylgeranyl pyrophosphate synthase
MGLPQAKEFARELLQDAHRALGSFDAKGQRLRDLADFIVQRRR